jgi:hypothetical protein
LWFAIAVGLALAPASCGGGEKAVVPTAERVGETGGSIVYRAQSAGVSIALPRSWQAISSENINQEKLEQFAEQNPSMARLIQQLYEPGSPIKIIAIGPASGPLFRTNLNVVVRDAEPGQTVAELNSPEQLEELERQAGSILNGPIESDLITLPAGNTHKLSFAATFKTTDGQPVSVYQEQYELISGGKYYALIYTAALDDKSDYQDVFTESAQSFRIGR